MFLKRIFERNKLILGVPGNEVVHISSCVYCRKGDFTLLSIIEPHHSHLLSPGIAVSNTGILRCFLGD